MTWIIGRNQPAGGRAISNLLFLAEKVITTKAASCIIADAVDDGADYVGLYFIKLLPGKNCFLTGYYPVRNNQQGGIYQAGQDGSIGNGHNGG